jgi:AraC family transcriptional regulator
LPCARIFESFYPERTALPRHGHATAHICFVLDGSYRETIGGEVHERGPGSAIYYPAGSAHAEEHHRAGRHFLIELDSLWLDQAIGARSIPAQPVELPADVRPMLRRLTTGTRQPDAAFHLLIESTLLELLARIGRPARSRPPSGERWLHRIQLTLDETFLSPPSLSELAREAGVHPAHLTRAFRRALGCSVGSYVRRLRVEYAWQRISRGAEPLSMIALEAGFADQSHMSRVLRRQTGVTPAAIRELGTAIQRRH